MVDCNTEIANGSFKEFVAMDLSINAKCEWQHAVVLAPRVMELGINGHDLPTFICKQKRQPLERGKTHSCSLANASDSDRAKEGSSTAS